MVVFMGCNDPYKVLGLKKNISKTDIKKAYRKLSLEYHPDKNQDYDNVNGATKKKYLDVQEAYEILTNAQKNKEYYARCNSYDIENLLSWLNTNKCDEVNYSLLKKTCTGLEMLKDSYTRAVEGPDIILVSLYSLVKESILLVDSVIMGLMPDDHN